MSVFQETLIAYSVDDLLYLSFCLFHQDGGRYDIETSPLVCSANQWTGFYMITASVLKGLNNF